MADPRLAVDQVEADQRPQFVLPPLPYGHDQLSPYMSEATLRTHHGKHHAKYVENVNRALAHEGPATKALEEVVVNAARRRTASLFNNAAQAWNHSFFWESMAPEPTAPEGQLAEAITRNFGDFASLRSRFIAEGAGHFASGWVWLSACGPQFTISSTHDAGTLVGDTMLVPLLVCDVWEHAYYLDHRQDRAAFLGLWWDNLANWAFAQRQFDAATGRGDAWQSARAI